MIIYERMADFIASLDTELPEHLRLLEKEALADEVPIIRKDSQSLLRFLIEMKRPKNILEIGTAVGFSASFMAEYMPCDCHLTTIEKVPMRIVEAEKNLAKLARKDDITFLTGDAKEVLEKLADEGRHFDFVFMDAAKAQYMAFLQSVMKMMEPGDLLVTDNVLQEGSIIDSKYVIERRDRTIHMRMREYLFELKHNERFTTSVVAVGDGMALSLVK